MVVQKMLNLKKPLGICIDNDDVMYIGDSENRAIRRLAVE